MYDQWGWWAGSSDEHFEAGPCDTKDDAIQEAIDQLAYTEHQDDNGAWLIGVHVAECKGTYYDCDECGFVEQACADCKQSLVYDEAPWFFYAVRGQEYVSKPHPDIKESTPTNTTEGERDE